MSSLWTPEGEHRVPPPDDSRPEPGSVGATPPTPEHLGDGGDDGWLDPEEEAARAEHLDELRRRLVDTPAEVVVANHAYGLFELAAIHLSQQPPHLDQARLAVDALGALVDGLAGRLGGSEASLRDALAQIRLAYVQIGGPADAPNGQGVESGGPAGD